MVATSTWAKLSLGNGSLVILTDVAGHGHHSVRSLCHVSSQAGACQSNPPSHWRGQSWIPSISGGQRKSLPWTAEENNFQ
ncbi:hypothetical protein DM01DRAFT_6108 [Hesseltinella vesiculosa]|uniref:Uncharacterized protein n=1 Tax=Hesseltinella vesiculosa TaxID=101127 RepID=A0A1X2GSX2_9FUNG|nr:hypothetical protein DM01DRAFT_6108 [Hesseltinella vesiculosa]